MCVMDELVITLLPIIILCIRVRVAEPDSVREFDPSVPY